MGISPDDPNAAEWLAQIAPVVTQTQCEILPENLIVFDIFLAMQTNWRVIAGMGGTAYQGLDYAAIPPVLQMFRIPKKDHADVFKELRLMEAEAIPLLNKKLS